MTKPCSPRARVARSRAILRRASGAVGAAASAEAPVEANGVRIDRARHEVLVDGAPVELPPKEFDLLATLVEHAGRVMTRNQLIDEVWGSDYFGDTKTLDVHIRRLRGRVEVDPREPVRIQTVRGVGYRFADA
ncbi:MAG: winged helix-turn-helix domain-containing protein, partial [Nitriliruptoraceae bacterium]